MRTGITTLIALLTCTMMLAAGCAKKEIVKAETPAPEVVVNTPPPPRPTPPPVRPAPEPEIPIVKEAPRIIEEVVTLKEDLSASLALRTIYFEYDSFVLSDISRDTLAKNAAVIKNNKGMKVQIQGNCDERGSDAYNLALGEKRAKAAFDYLITLGTPLQQLSFISYGEEHPADAGHDEAAWTKNRRDDFIVLK